MHPRPYWAIECVSREDAETLLASAPVGSKIEVVPKDSAELVILWVPIPDDVMEAELG